MTPTPEAKATDGLVEALRECPFCSLTAAMICLGSDDLWRVRCGFCFASGTAKAEKPDAIVAWNKRVPAFATIHEDEGWRPISEAPRDGTAILITRPTEFESEEGWHVVRWDDDWYDDGWWVCHDGKFDTPLRGPEPTHFRSLPAAPQGQSDHTGEGE